MLLSMRWDDENGEREIIVAKKQERKPIVERASFGFEVFARRGG
jgi:hypothetical protein